MSLVAIPLSFAGGLPPAPPPLHQFRQMQGTAMGTTWQINCFAPPDCEFRTPVEAALAQLISEMSHWDPASDLSRFNTAPPESWVDLPERLLHVLRAGLVIAKASGGAFDPTLGKSVNAWGFGPPEGRTEGTSGWEQLQLAYGRAWQPGGLLLDLSAIAKGYAVDEVSRVLDQMGVSSYLVEIGGELRGAGVKPGGEPWWVAVEQPSAELLPGFPEMLVALCGQSIATSGDYRRFFLRDGVRFAHTIDPQTGEPIHNELASVTVIHSDCIRADAYSTALNVLGLDAGLAFATRENLAALFVVRGAAAFEHHASPQLLAMLD